MREYHIMGKVCKDEYGLHLLGDIIGSRLKEDYIEEEIWFVSHPYINMRLTNESIMKLLVQEQTAGIKKYKLRKQSLITIHTIKEYKEYDTLKTNIKFRDGDYMYKNNIKYIYKYNEPLKRHELYTEYILDTEVNTVWKKECEDRLVEINKMIDEYNKSLDEEESIKIVKNEKKSFIKKLFGGK